jgi:glycosyltransferase involved in cell wall biosynthesis
VDKQSLQIHVWVPELISSRGGIQRFSSSLIEALTEIVGRNNVRVMAKNDPPSGMDSELLPRSSGWGNWPLKLRSLAFAIGVVWSAMRDRPRLVITTHLNFSIAGYLLKSLTGIPYWCVAHGVEAWNVDRRLSRLGLQNSDLILAVSNYTRQRLLAEQPLKAQRVVILPNTVHGEVMKPGPKPDYLMRRHALTIRNKIILTVARLAEPERYKGYDQVLRALPAIRDKIPDVKYVLVGEGGDRPRIETLIRDLEIRDAVILAGGVSARELPDYYNLCDVFAMPSKGEGFGIVYLEAMACGKPVLAGNDDGSSEPVQNGRLGVLVDADSVIEIAKELTRVLEGTHPLDVLYAADRLREESLKKFGFVSFKERLSNLLNQRSEDGGHRPDGGSQRAEA